MTFSALMKAILNCFGGLSIKSKLSMKVDTEIGHTFIDFHEFLPSPVGWTEKNDLTLGVVGLWEFKHGVSHQLDKP